MTDKPILRSELLAMVKHAHQSLEPWGALVEEIEKRGEPELPTQMSDWDSHYECDLKMTDLIAARRDEAERRLAAERQRDDYAVLLKLWLECWDRIPNNMPWPVTATKAALDKGGE